MKKHLFKLAFGLALVVASALTFSACDLFDDATDVTFTKDFETSLTVVPGEAIDIQKTIDLASDPEIAKYKDKFKEVIVESAKYHVEEYSGSQDTKVTGKVSFSGSAVSITANLDNVSLKSATTPVDFGIAGTELTQLASLFKSEKKAVFSVKGTLNPGADFGGCTLVVTLKLKITAEAL